MTDRDTRSLKVLNDWNSLEYKNDSQKAASLQCLINSALEEQDYLTRVACADSMLERHGARAANACIAVKAL